jgi:TetR/AcrR family transcriptional regulator
MSVSAQRRETERRRRVETILKAARVEFLSKGYQGATMRDIARRAGVTTGALYFHFPGKDEIYGRICEEVLELHVRIIGNAKRPKGSVKKRMRAVAESYLTIYTDFRDDFDLLDFEFHRLDLSPGLAQRLEELVRESLSYPYQIIIEAKAADEIAPRSDPWELTFRFWAAVEGLLYIHKRQHLDGFSYDLKKLITRQIDNFVQGILKPVPRP